MVDMFNTMLSSYLKLPELDRRLSELEVKAVNDRVEIASLTAKIDDLEKNVTYLREERARLIAENYDLMNECDVLKTQVTSLTERSDNQAVIIEDYQSKAMEAAELIEHLKDDFATSQSELDRMGRVAGDNFAGWQLETERANRAEAQLAETSALLDAARVDLSNSRNEASGHYEELVRVRRESDDWQRIANDRAEKIEAVRQALNATRVELTERLNFDTPQVA